MPLQRAWRQSNPVSRWVPFYRAGEVFLGRTRDDDRRIGVPGARLGGLRRAQMSERIARLNGAARAVKNKLFMVALVVVDDGLNAAPLSRERVSRRFRARYGRNVQLSAWTGTL